MTREITLTTPDDWHLHLRDDMMLKETVPASSRCFHRAIVMPNLVPPVTTGEMAMAYRARILDQVPANQRFQPLMTLYLSGNTTADTVREAQQMGVTAAKLYPAGATTNSDQGVSKIQQLHSTFEAMAEIGMPLLIHGEVTDSDIDIFDREKIFIERHLQQIVTHFPQLKVVFEHITTADAVDFVQSAPAQVAATITPQHLLLNRNDMLVGGIRPHNYCLPVLKRQTHQQALQAAAVSGSPKFFIGTDSAPHARHKKEAACGCAGCYSAHSAIELYTQFFDEMGALDKLEAFTSHFGADFYGMPRNETHITVVKESWTVPESIDLADGSPIVPFFAGKTLDWKVKTT